MFALIHIGEMRFAKGKFWSTDTTTEMGNLFPVLPFEVGFVTKSRINIFQLMPPDEVAFFSANIQEKCRNASLCSPFFYK
jgi:hypothetical protein